MSYTMQIFMLIAAKCSPSLLNEMRDCRGTIGETAKFKIQFAGNPKPDIQWYFNNVQLRASEKYRMVVEESDASLEIFKITNEDCGNYTCKLINEIGMTMTRAKFDISSTGSEETEHIKTKSTVKKKASKKTMAKRSGASDSMTAHRTEIRIVPASRSETTMNIVKVKQAVPILIEHSDISEVIQVKDRKIADAEQRTSRIIKEIVEEEDEEEDEEEEDFHVEKKYTSSKTIQLTETVELIRLKVTQKTIKIEDIYEISQHEEVQWLLESVEAESFGKTGEAALRDLATISVLLRYGCTHYEITYMYEQNIFISLQKPESQSALVQLVEREGHDELITQILSESSNEDETILAATVGFKAFILMIQSYEITIETVIRKFHREDFISHDWKICGKERIVETSQIIESHEAITHVKIEETFVEERTIVVNEGLNINTDQL